MRVQAADQHMQHDGSLHGTPHTSNTYNLLEPLGLGDELSCCAAAVTVCPVRMPGDHNTNIDMHVMVEI